MGTLKRGVFNVGPVSRTLTSVDRLHETGHDVILTKNKQRIVNLSTGEVMPLKKHGGMFILDMSHKRVAGGGCKDIHEPR